MWPFGRKNAIGLCGEKLARQTLQKAGCRILACNYRCPAGEADLVALDGETLVFAEVKTRNSDRYTDPQSAVDAGKQGRYRKVAKYYLQRTGSHERPVRFDVIGIVMAPGQEPRVTHIPDAFQ